LKYRTLIAVTVVIGVGQAYAGKHVRPDLVRVGQIRAETRVVDDDLQIVDGVPGVQEVPVQVRIMEEAGRRDGLRGRCRQHDDR
jgi:hypothetical protein